MRGIAGCTWPPLRDPLDGPDGSTYTEWSGQEVVRSLRVSRSWAGAVTTRAFIWLMAWVRALTAESVAVF